MSANRRGKNGKGQHKPKGRDVDTRVKRDDNPRNRFTPKQRAIESDDMRKSVPEINDPGWYYSSVDMRQAFYSFPFNAPLGLAFQSKSASLDDSSVPGVLAYYFTPTAGVASSANDALNVAAQRSYSFVRYANSGHANYDATDLMLYYLAADSLEMYATFLQRIYGMVRMYNRTNWYYPEALLKANFVNPADIQQHIPDLYGYIQLFVAKASSMAVPAGLSYNLRHAWMARNIWLDNPDTNKAQTMMYVPQSYYTFTLDSNGAGQLEQLRLFDVNSYIGEVGTENLLTFAQLVSFGNNLLNNMLQQEDFGIMSGDVMKAYPNNYRVIQTIPQDYVALPQYSQEVLSQMENAVVYSGVIGSNITQSNPNTPDTNYLVTQPRVELNTFILVDNPAGIDNAGGVATAIQTLYQAVYSNECSRMLNFHKELPTTDDVAVATRLIVQMNTSGAPGWQFRKGSYSPLFLSQLVNSCGSEIICGARIFTNEVIQGQSKLYAFDVPSYLNVAIPARTDNYNMTGIALIAARLEMLENFDWHHGVCVGGTVYTPSSADMAVEGSFAPQGIAIDADQYTWIDSVNITNMHNAALLNELWAPAS